MFVWLEVQCLRCSGYTRGYLHIKGGGHAEPRLCSAAVASFWLGSACVLAGTSIGGEDDELELHLCIDAAQTVSPDLWGTLLLPSLPLLLLVVVVVALPLLLFSCPATWSSRSEAPPHPRKESLPHCRRDGGDGEADGVTVDAGLQGELVNQLGLACITVISDLARSPNIS